MAASSSRHAVAPSRPLNGVAPPVVPATPRIVDRHTDPDAWFVSDDQKARRARVNAAAMGRPMPPR